MGTTSAEVDADFLDLFDDFNEEDALDSVFISENLLEVSGMTAAPVVHAGEADEGESRRPGAHNSARGAGFFRGGGELFRGRAHQQQQES